MKSFPKRVIAITMCIVFALSNFAYADTVVIGSAPGSGNRTMDTNATTTYLQNQYTGPGLLPNSSRTNYTPIQGVSYDQSIGQASASVDENGVSYDGPSTKIITSPAANNAEIAAVTGTSNVIANGVNLSKSDETGTADAGPTTYEILSPTAGDPNIRSENSGPGVAINQPTEQTSIPSYTTNQIASYQTNNQAATATINTGVIIYSANDNIRAAKPNVTSPAAIVVNATTRQIYFCKGGFTAYQPAALANLVTASLLLTYKGINDVLAVSASAVTGLESGASVAGLRAGDTITVRDALGALFVRSCCDVANVIAENVAGSTANFVGLMNQTVKNWGCVGTNFTNPTGLNNDAQLTNTYDMAIIMDKVSSDPTLKIMLQQAAYVLPATAHRGAKNLTTTNQLLIPGNKNYYTGISASRMGYTSKAKYTIASELDYNGQRLIAVVLHSNGAQWTDTTRLLNFAKVASLEGGNAGATYNTIMNTGANVSTGAMATANLAAALPMNNAAATAAVNSGTNSLISSAGDTQGIWQKDSKGWFFIKSNGQSATNEWITQGGKIYCVDSSGYMVTGWKQMSNGAMYYFDPSSGELRHSTWVNVSTGAYYLQDDGTLAKADKGTTKNIITSVGTYTIDENGKAVAKVA